MALQTDFFFQSNFVFLADTDTDENCSVINCAQPTQTQAFFAA